MDDYNKHRSMVWPDPYLVPSLRDPRIKWTIHGLLRKARIHALSSATHARIVICGLRTTYMYTYNILLSLAYR